ncbi:GFA family protein [Phaeobacter gallaeciensis]|uniref:GFA family protein n=1 Tax=Phaeobacter gallaeciensis TaxID=60890 RepID=UPI00237EFB0B|nr:GFA family protein [Phaeobacter gallaeciensis]MDE4303506.1 GFA family protein [Phaeobacter gallaeciensis]MDE4308012.1 GFA family protein [Phaeobacter gallaeciensis]MDE4312470.1 GFA family protein [Phaeobacter gallaeciensis]MDE4316941.1 GFA family protein [Phaeobacter gallaeciensis]MDE4321404.1 GFA family protein [Phaeobacter gallaeciensis]
MAEAQAEFSAGCLCGAVRITARGRPRRVGICHCLECRKHHGALFYAAAVFPEDAVSVTGETGAYEGRHFCPRCGSSVFARTDDEIELHLGALDAPDQLVPEYEIWTRRRESWLPEFAQMQRFSGNREDGQSDED